MLKKVIISGIAFGLILLVGYGDDENKKQVQAVTEVLENEQEVVVTPSNEEDDEILNLLNEIKKELIVSIAKQAGIEKKSIEIIVSTGSVEGNIDVHVSVDLPKDAKIDEATIQQIVEDVIRIVSKKENVTISEENIEITND